MEEGIVLLHGFGATHRAWDAVRARLDREGGASLAPDLPGHGSRADCARPITFAACVEQILALAPERFLLCGYSLGGRVALHVALAAPERVSALVLVSSSAGIEQAHERDVRRAADERLAQRLREEPFEDFIEAWRTQPLFAGESPEVAALAREDQRRNRPDALAAVLLGLGAGAMQPLWDRLAQLTMPASVLAGERDERYVALGRRLGASLPDARLAILPGGHNLPLESPSELARSLRSTLQRLDPEAGAARHGDAPAARR